MSSDDWREDLPKKVRVMKILVGAMIVSCLLVLVVILPISAVLPGVPNMEFMAAFALIAAIFSIILWASVPALIVPGGRKTILAGLREQAEKRGTEMRRGDFEAVEGEAGRRLIELLMRKTILCAALLEGPAFLALVAYFLGRSPLSLAIAVVLLLLIALSFPTFDRTSNWIERQMQLLKDEF